MKMLLLSFLAVVFLSHALNATRPPTMVVYNDADKLLQHQPNMTKFERKVIYTLGERVKGDYLVYGVIKEPGYIVHVGNGQVPAKTNITYVEFNYLDNMESYPPYVKDGGIGQNSITIVADEEISKSICVYATLDAPIVVKTRTTQLNAT